jgi:hypothetical protein
VSISSHRASLSEIILCGCLSLIIVIVNVLAVLVFRRAWVHNIVWWLVWIQCLCIVPWTPTTSWLSRWIEILRWVVRVSLTKMSWCMGWLVEYIKCIS